MNEKDKPEFKIDLDDGEKVVDKFVIKDNLYEEQGFLSKIKTSIGKIAIIVLLVLCIIGNISLWAAFSSTKDSLTEISKKTEGIDLKGIKTQIADLESRIEGLKKENEGLKAELAGIKNEMEKIRTAKIRPAAPQAQKQNKTAKPKRR